MKLFHFNAIFQKLFDISMHENMEFAKQWLTGYQVKQGTDVQLCEQILMPILMAGPEKKMGQELKLM